MRVRKHESIILSAVSIAVFLSGFFVMHDSLLWSDNEPANFFYLLLSPFDYGIYTITLPIAISLSCLGSAYALKTDWKSHAITCIHAAAVMIFSFISVVILAYTFSDRNVSNAYIDPFVDSTTETLLNTLSGIPYLLEMMISLALGAVLWGSFSHTISLISDNKIIVVFTTSIVFSAINSTMPSLDVGTYKPFNLLYSWIRFNGSYLAKYIIVFSEISIFQLFHWAILQIIRTIRKKQFRVASNGHYGIFKAVLLSFAAGCASCLISGTAFNLRATPVATILNLLSGYELDARISPHEAYIHMIFLFSCIQGSAIIWHTRDLRKASFIHQKLSNAIQSLSCIIFYALGLISPLLLHGSIKWDGGYWLNGEISYAYICLQTLILVLSASLFFSVLTDLLGDILRSAYLASCIEMGLICVALLLWPQINGIIGYIANLVECSMRVQYLPFSYGEKPYTYGIVLYLISTICLTILHAIMCHIRKSHSISMG